MKTKTIASIAALAISLNAPLFTAEISLESAPPVVVKTVPTAGATDVDPALAEIRVTYSKVMQDGSWSWSTWGEENYPETTGAPNYLADNRTCVLPVKLQGGKFYAIWLNSENFTNFKDAGGRAAVPYLLSFRTRESAGGGRARSSSDDADQFKTLLNEDQRAVLEWTDRQFGGMFDKRTFDGLSQEERAKLEAKLLDALNGPRSGEYFQAINTLPALRSATALPKLRAIAFERVDRNNRDRWMAVRALGLMGDREAVPDLIHLIYHGNQNTHWWAQLSLVRITGQNFGKDWNAWGKWWNEQKGAPPFKPEVIRWWDGQPEPDKLAASLEENDQKFLTDVKRQGSGKPAQTAEQYIEEQTKQAEVGNYWAKFRLWEAYSKGTHEVTKNSAEAEKWLAEVVKGAYLANFEPVNDFNPKTPREMLDSFSQHSQLRSGRDRLGGASFFRTTNKGGKLIGSFLTELPDDFKKAVEQHPNLKLISIEKLTPEMFLAHEASRQEALDQ